ncbi:Transmembrane secretion effector [Terribacillus aidingensis]|uniref:Transmembrane secretion effector n=1 Tax=Terribacillus aidingensis TaxID=586416 RepID=A0A285PEB7_9BACI|nr:MFS transporter [Terribacillus aidingensis]SNZ18211.1 Transmembrane secretion effector [Terribacillus aidingensis]
MYRDIWKNRHVIYYFSGGAVSQIGNVLSGLGFLFLAYRLTESNVQTTCIAIAETVPYLMFGLIGGAAADVMNRKKMMIMMDLLRFGITSVTVILYFQDWLNFYHLLTGSFLLQCSGCFFNPAHRAVLPELVKERQLPAANSAWDTIQRSASLAGPILAVWMLAKGDIVYLFIADALSFAISAVCISRLPPIPRLTKQESLSLSSLYKSMWAFVQYGKNNSVLVRLFSITFLVVFFNTWVWQVGMLLAFEEITTNGERWFNALQIFYGIAATIISVLLPYLLNQLNMKKYLIGSIIWGLGISLIGFVYELPFFFIGALLIGIGLPISSLTRVYLIQTSVPKSMLGRAFSTNTVLLYAANTLSLSIYASLLPVLSIRMFMLISGLAILLVVCLYVFNSLFRKSPGV